MAANPRTILVFDTETSGLPKRAGFEKLMPAWDLKSYDTCRVIQLGWAVYTPGGQLMRKRSVYIRPEGFVLEAEAAAVNKITMEQLDAEGAPVRAVLKEFAVELGQAGIVVGHNARFDVNALASEAWRLGMTDLAAAIEGAPVHCTMRLAKEFCGAKGQYGIKFPRLAELYKKIFGSEPAVQHDALADVEATAACYFALRDVGIVL
jgi:DNA polymerase III epsilon subunit-like protein